MTDDLRSRTEPSQPPAEGAGREAPPGGGADAELRATDGPSSDAFGVAARRGSLTLYARRTPHAARPLRERTSDPLIALQEEADRPLVSHLQAGRDLGLFVSGRPGTGKSTLLLHLALEDIRKGRACCVLDPHGDLVTSILERCPEEAMERVLVLDPGDTQRPVGLDLLDARTEWEQDHCVQFMLSLFEELFLAEHQGPILHQAISNTMRLAMETGGTLAEVPALLGDKDLLKKRLSECQNPWVEHYFRHVWLEITGSDRAEHLAYFSSKVARFLDDSMLRNIFGQKSGPDLAAHLESGGVLLASLSRGSLGDVNARLVGMVLLQKLERITLQRDALSVDERRPLHIYVDECHDVVTRSLPRFLAAARKFNVGLTLADQQVDSLSKALQESVLGSIGHHVLFRQGGSSELHRLTRLLWPRFGERELLSVPNFHALLRVTNGGGEHCLGRLRLPRPGPGSAELERRIRLLSRRRFGRPQAAVESEILDRLGWAPAATGQKPAPEGPDLSTVGSGAGDAAGNSPLEPDGAACEPAAKDPITVWLGLRLSAPNLSGGSVGSEADAPGDQSGSGGDEGDDLGAGREVVRIGSLLLTRASQLPPAATRERVREWFRVGPALTARHSNALEQAGGALFRWEDDLYVVVARELEVEEPGEVAPVSVGPGVWEVRRQAGDEPTT